jgi:hypothetical protein
MGWEAILKQILTTMSDNLNHWGSPSGKTGQKVPQNWFVECVLSAMPHRLVVQVPRKQGDLTQSSPAIDKCSWKIHDVSCPRKFPCSVHRGDEYSKSVWLSSGLASIQAIFYWWFSNF